MELDFRAHERSADDQDEEAPPCYYASLRGNAKNTQAISHSWASHVQQQDQPPRTNWFVRSPSDPSSWQLLASGSLMSNVTSPINNASTHKQRYRILYPACKYEDVYLHRPLWTAQASAFPHYHIEVYSGKSRYSAEPIVILGSASTENVTQSITETQTMACLHTARVVSAVERQVKDMTRQATFAEMEFRSWDWTCKTSAANHDMRTMILRAQEECAKSVELVEGLKSFLKYAGYDAEMTVSASLMRSCEEVRRKLERFRL